MTAAGLQLRLILLNPFKLVAGSEEDLSKLWTMRVLNKMCGNPLGREEGDRVMDGKETMC